VPAGEALPMKSNAILQLMVADHAKILKLLTDVERSLGKDVTEVLKSFNTFEWELEKHMFTEEKAIFTSYTPTNIFEGYKIVPDLMKQHDELSKYLAAMRKAVMWQQPTPFKDLKDLLISHKMFEEVSLYPKLDEELDEKQKNEIISRIRQMVE
jgi:iron-sulfur cluster repair protein YtfE (RIC family)